MAGEISVQLGGTWIPQKDIQQFIMEFHYRHRSMQANRLKVRYTPINGVWFIENKGSDFGNVKSEGTDGTKRVSAYRIIEDTLNLRDVRIFDYVLDGHGNKKRCSTVIKPPRHKPSKKLSNGHLVIGFE